MIVVAFPYARWYDADATTGRARLGEVIEQAVLRVVTTMRGNPGENLTVDDMARVAMYSKFHFIRAFRQITGVPPGRFLSAVRIAEAKRLLVATSLTVTEISHRVGYTSVGTFTSRFTGSVGSSPTGYRERGGRVTLLRESCRPDAGPGSSTSTTVRGEVRSPVAGTGPVFVGLFRGPIPQGQPIRCAVLPRPGPYTLPNVPAGLWYLMARSAATDDVDPYGDAGAESAPAVGSHGPIRVRPGRPVVRTADLPLRPTRPFDPPILFGMLDRHPAALNLD